MHVLIEKNVSHGGKREHEEDINYYSEKGINTIGITYNKIRNKSVKAQIVFFEKNIMVDWRLPWWSLLFW